MIESLPPPIDKSYEFTFPESSQEVLQGLVDPDSFSLHGFPRIEKAYHGITTKEAYHESLLQAADTKQASSEGIIGLPGSGKTIITLQHIARLERDFNIRGINKKIKYLPWGQYLLSYFQTDPSRFGTLSPEDNAEASEAHAEQAERIMEDPNIHLYVDVPGIEHRGGTTIQRLAENSKNFHVRAVFADERIRTATKQFRDEVQQTKSPSALKKLLRFYGMSPHGEINTLLLQTLQKNGATAAGMKRVDDELNDTLASIIFTGNNPETGILDVLPDEHRDFRGSVVPTSRLSDPGFVRHMLDVNMQAREQAVAGYFLNVFDKLGISQNHRILQFNPQREQGEVHLREDMLDRLQVQFDPGGIVRI